MKYVCLSAQLLFLIPALVFAQDNAQISGFVRDGTGSVVPQSTITVKNEGNSVQRQTTTNEAGYYVVSTLPPGYYTVVVEAKGFKRFQKSQNKLDPNIPTTIDAQLEVGAVTETVDVVASVVKVQSETATVGKLIESSQIANMQLNGRNPLFLALLKPGVRGGSLQAFNFGLSSGGFSINGSRPEHNLITVDGAISTRTRANDSSIGVTDVETVQEMQILTANYTAEYGRSGGGQIRIVTKSGTRKFHGDLYDYFRNSALNGNTWARNRTPGRPDISGTPEAFRYNQFGYLINGPVLMPGQWNKDRNKLFFSFGQEWVRFRRSLTAINTVPSTAMRQGDFSELLNAANPYYGRVRVINDPATGGPFPGNIIPRNRLSRNGAAFLNAYPAVVPGFLQGRNNYIATRPQPENQRKETLSVDWNASEKHQVRFRHLNYNFEQIGAFRTDTDRAPASLVRPNKTFSLNYVWTLSPTLVNELLLTTSYDRVWISVVTEGDRYRRSLYGIDYPYLFPERKEIFDKIPTIDVANFVSVDGGPYPASTLGPIYVASNNVSKVYGTHTLRAGILFERAGENDFDQINVQGVPGGTNNQNGRFVFDDTRSGSATTGLAVANAALGMFTTYSEIGDRSFTPYRSHMYEWFVQDSWKATPKLRLEMGLRHSIFQPFYSLWRNMAVFDPRLYDPTKAAVQDPATGFVFSGDRYNGVVIPGDKWPESAKGRIALAADRDFDRLFRGVRKEFAPTHYKNFQPRLGMAYEIKPGSVIRAGVGRFFNRQLVGGSVFLGGNPPLQPMVSISNGLADNPGGGRPSFFPLNMTTRDPVFKDPSAYTWNVTVERAVGFQSTIEISYVGRRGLWMERERNINQLAPGTVQANRGVNPDVLRPYKGFGPIRMGENAASSIYHGLQLGWNRRFTKGLSYGVAYTYASSKDNASNYRDLLPNNFDDKKFWGPSNFDTRHVMVLNFIYEVPLFRDTQRLSGKLLGGWQFTGVSQFQSGTPFTVSTGDDFAGVGVGSGNQYWNISGNSNLPRGDRKFSEGATDQNFWFAARNADGTSIFRAPAAGTFGNQTRNTLYQPGFQNWNLALFKNFPFKEHHRVQFRLEAYNWPNHPNFGNADTNPLSGTFGKVTGKASERQLQLSLRYSF